ncbi:hypothetical protein [Pseudonocardia humida]|uniref:Uncharacterized protein n=1 Tax=Pseudonocardia humida TaxID=2800819 RepID=A0ABT1A206_9PSEU|nr:hypothetical protein [Pseudonocardia humida]MCO1656991.1 hypothetical protein [Pseudonocardia humida]
MERTTCDPLTGRDRAILRAVATGTAELTGGAEPDLLLDGRYCCDQEAAHRLARAGLIAPTAVRPVGQRVAAVVTAAGLRALRAAAPAAA